jgi:hypothetical protein
LEDRAGKGEIEALGGEERAPENRSSSPRIRQYEKVRHQGSSSKKVGGRLCDNTVIGKSKSTISRISGRSADRFPSRISRGIHLPESGNSMDCNYWPSEE